MEGVNTFWKVIKQTEWGDGELVGCGAVHMGETLSGILTRPRESLSLSSRG